MLDAITPIILTFDEEANIGRCLAGLTWAYSVLVVDSFSTDKTVEIARSFANVKLIQNRFVDPASQLNFALDSGEVKTPWILRMDADYLLAQPLRQEIDALDPPPTLGAYRIPFRYAVQGRELRASLYPALPLLARVKALRYWQDGHTEKAKIAAPIGELNAPMIHDDRKPLGRWLHSQWRYMEREADKLRASTAASLDWADRLRKTRVLAAPAMFFYCLVVKGLMLDGWAGMFYTLQRVTAELILALCLIDRDFQALFSAGHDDHPGH